MKYLLVSLVAILVMPIQASALSEPPTRSTVYRLYNSAINDHFYTTSSIEASNAVTFHGYKKESEMGYVEKTQVTGTIGIIRMWNPGGRKHFYTTSEVEATSAQSLGYIREGVIGYLQRDLAPQDNPASPPEFAPEENEPLSVYRLYNSAQEKHFYTVYQPEMLQALSMGYRLEGDLGTLYKNLFD